MFWGVAEITFISEEQMPSFDGKRGTKTIFGIMKHKKTCFCLFGVVVFLSLRACVRACVRA